MLWVPYNQFQVIRTSAKHLASFLCTKNDNILKKNILNVTCKNNNK